jgi:hypothetical protein
MTVSTVSTPTVIDLIARRPPAASSKIKDINPLRLIRPHSQDSNTELRFGELHDVEVIPSFEANSELIRKGYYSLKDLINKPIFNLDRFITIQNNLIQNYEAVNNLHIDKLKYLSRTSETPRSKQ